MKKIQLYSLLCIICFSIGCTSKPVTRINHSFVNQVNDKLKQYQTAASSRPDDAKSLRNEAVEDVLAYIDANYQDFISDLETKHSWTNFVADVIELGAGAATGIVKGERAIQVIGVALTAFRATRKSFEVNLYKEQTTPILINKMDDNRAKVYAIILEKRNRELADYPWKEAVRDIVAYYNAGTLVRAFTELSKDTAAQAKESEDRVLELKGVPLSKPATVRTRGNALDARTVILKLENSLANASEKADATKKLQEIFKALEADASIKPLVTEAGVSSQETDGAKLLAALRAIRTKIFRDNDLSDRVNQIIVEKGN